MDTMSEIAAYHFARLLLNEHGLENWKIVFDNALRRAGQCRYSKCEISLSRIVMSHCTVRGTQDTIRHEVAHALVGPGHGHDRAWKRTLLYLGGTGDRCFDSSEFVAEIKGRYEGKCINCGRTVYMHRRPRVTRSCGDCNSKRFDPSCVFHFTDTRTGSLVAIG